MKRIIVASALGLSLGLFAVGCSDGGSDGESKRREPPTEKVAAPGSDLSAPEATEEGTPPEGE